MDSPLLDLIGLVLRLLEVELALELEKAFNREGMMWTIVNLAGLGRPVVFKAVGEGIDQECCTGEGE